MHTTRFVFLGAALLICIACGGSSSDDTSDSSQPADLSAVDLGDTSVGTPDTSVADLGQGDSQADLRLQAFPWSTENTDELCTDNKDNDNNGFKDCEDFGCARNLSVFVCGDQGRFENSPDRCADNKDNDGDGLIDCNDPDCGKNPFHDVCNKPKPESNCDDGLDNDNDGHKDCLDFDCKIHSEACRDQNSKRILFDQTVDITSSSGPNSDWVIDPLGRFPLPSNPTAPSDWHGALSHFGFDLHQQGYILESLVPWDGLLSYQDPNNKQDLSEYQLLILFEPSMQMSDDQKTAIIRFVLDGGSLLMVANHVGADRDGNGWSAPQVFNDMLSNNTFKTDPFGFTIDEVDLDTGSPLQTIVAPQHPVLDGPFGKVGRIGFYKGCSARLTDNAGVQVSALIQFDNPTDPKKDIVVLASLAGKGRVVFIADSAIAGDGSDSHGNDAPFHDSWNNSSQDNRALFLNAVDWLLKRD